MVLLVPGVVILLDETKVLLPLALQSQLPPLHVCREITLQQENLCQGRTLFPPHKPSPEILPVSCTPGNIRHRNSGARDKNLDGI